MRHKMDFAQFGLLIWVIAVLTVPAANKTASPLRQARIFGGPLESSLSDFQLHSQDSDSWASSWPENIALDSLTDGQPANTIRQGRMDVSQKPYILAVSCGNERMNVEITFHQPFSGIIYSKGFYNKPECLYVKGDNRSGAYNFSVEYDKCGSFSRKAETFVDPPTRPTTIATTTQSTTTTTFPTTLSDTNINWFTQDMFSMGTPSINVGSATSPSIQLTSQLSSLNPVTPPQYSSLPHPASYPVSPIGFMGQPLQQLQYNGFGQPSYQMNNGYPGVQRLLPTSLQGYGNQIRPSYLGQGAPLYSQNMGMSYPSYGMVNPYGRLGRSLDSDDPVDLHWVENTIIIQQDPSVQDALDEAKSLQCEWKERYNKKLVSTGYHAATAEIVRASFPGNDAVGAYMQIRSGLGPLSPETKGVIKIGSPLTLVIALSDSSNKFDLMVHSCFAKGGGASPPLQLVDENGCVVREKHIGPFTPFFDKSSSYGNNRVAFAFFQAFKFPDSTEVNVDCSVTICRESCTRQCFGKYEADGKNYTKIFANEPEKPSQKISRPVNMNATSNQERIIEALERRLSEVNGPQTIELKVGASSPVKLSGARFLQLRDLEHDNETSPGTTPKSSFTKKVKREVPIESSNVDLRRKLTVIYPSEIDGISDTIRLPEPTQLIPARSFSTIPPNFFPKSHASVAYSSATMAASPTTASVSAATISKNTSVPTEKVTPVSKFYVMEDDQKHVCLPMMILIFGGAVTSFVLFASLLCSACVCFKNQNSPTSQDPFTDLGYYRHTPPISAF